MPSLNGRPCSAEAALAPACQPATNLPATRTDLFARLAELGIATNTVDHDAVFTVAESSRLERDLPGGHTKNLFLKDRKDGLFLVVALGATRVDLKSLRKRLGADGLSFANPCPFQCSRSNQSYAPGWRERGALPCMAIDYSRAEKGTGRRVRAPRGVCP